MRSLAELILEGCCDCNNVARPCVTGDHVHGVKPLVRAGGGPEGARLTGSSCRVALLVILAPAEPEHVTVDLIHRDAALQGLGSDSLVTVAG